MNSNSNKKICIKQKDFEIIKKAKLDTSKEISSKAINKDKLNSISPLDACTCTGNCNGGGGNLILIM